MTILGNIFVWLKKNPWIGIVVVLAFILVVFLTMGTALIVMAIIIIHKENQIKKLNTDVAKKDLEISGLKGQLDEKIKEIEGLNNKLSAISDESESYKSLKEKHEKLSAKYNLLLTVNEKFKENQLLTAGEETMLREYGFGEMIDRLNFLKNYEIERDKLLQEEKSIEKNTAVIMGNKISKLSKEGNFNLKNVMGVEGPYNKLVTHPNVKRAFSIWTKLLEELKVDTKYGLHALSPDPEAIEGVATSIENFISTIVRYIQVPLIDDLKKKIVCCMFFKNFSDKYRVMAIHTLYIYFSTDIHQSDYTIDNVGRMTSWVVDIGDLEKKIDKIIAGHVLDWYITKKDDRSKNIYSLISMEFESINKSTVMAKIIGSLNGFFHDLRDSNGGDYVDFRKMVAGANPQNRDRQLDIILKYLNLTA